MPVKPASPIPRSMRSTIRLAKEVAILWREATRPQERTMAVM